MAGHEKPPAGFSGGTDLAYAGGDFIYALRGGGTTNFDRYSISGNSWTTLASTPGGIGGSGGGTLGGDLVYGGGDYIYALRGRETTDFYRYSISGNSWVSMVSTPNTVGGPTSGAALARAGGYIYASRGASKRGFWRFSSPSEGSAVGGDVYSIDKLSLLTPYIITILMITTVTVILFKKRKH